MGAQSTRQNCLSVDYNDTEPVLFPAGVGYGEKYRDFFNLWRRSTRLTGA